jgi:hypothetical protein
VVTPVSRPRWSYSPVRITGREQGNAKHQEIPMDRTQAELEDQEIELLPSREAPQVAGFDFMPINFASSFFGTATAAQVVTLNLRF